MAGRPAKQGLDFFSMDVGFDSDEKIEVLEAEFGPIAIAVVMVLLSRIYERGYYLEWNPRLSVVQGKRFGIDMDEFVKSCCKWGLFDEDKFTNHSILTSERIQNFYLFATARRKEVEEIDPDYMLLGVDDCDEDNDTETSDIELLQHKSYTNSTQSELMSTEIQLSRINDDDNEQSKSKRESKREIINTHSPRERAREGLEGYELPPKAADDPELVAFFTSLGGTPEMAADFFDHYNSQNWVKSSGMPISSWRSLANKWIREEKFNPGKRSRASPRTNGAQKPAEKKYKNPKDQW
jgi:hypothetical protein